MKKRLTWLGVVALLFSVVAFGPSVGASTQASTSPDRPRTPTPIPQPRPRSPLENIPITGSVVGGIGSFSGTVDIVNFANNNGVMVANGLLDGRLVMPIGTTTISNVYVTLPAV